MKTNMAEMLDEVVLTPIRSDDGKAIKIERVPLYNLDPDKVRHIAGGPYKGLVIHEPVNKKPWKKPPDATRIFFAHVHDLTDDDEFPTKERREIRFWFKESKDSAEEVAGMFIDSLIQSGNFPKDYVSFLKRCLQLVKELESIKRLELHITDVPLGDAEHEASISMATAAMANQDDFLKQKHGTSGESFGEWSSKESRVRLRQGEALSGQKSVGAHQEDFISAEGVLQRGLTGTFHQTDTASDAAGERLVHTLGFKNEHGNPYYAQQLLSDSYNTPKTPAEPYVTVDGAISTPEKVRRNKKKNKRAEKAGEDAISERAARAALAAAGVTAVDDMHPEWTAVKAPHITSGREGKQLTISLRGWKVIWAAKKQKVLTLLEDVYPNILAVDDLIRITGMKKADVEYAISEVTSRSMAQEVTRGYFMRTQPQKKIYVSTRSLRKSRALSTSEPQKKHEVKVVDIIPQLPAKEQPKIAIITLLYCEKLAVDAMMESKTTYVRYKTDGEGQAYTLGYIGKHRAVSTKLSRVGPAGVARVAAGNVVTRLLGIFGDVEHVFLVGVAGGVLLTDSARPLPRLGDVVISRAATSKDPIYINTDKVTTSKKGKTKFSVQSWTPQSDELHNLASDFERETKKDFDVLSMFSKHMKLILAELEGSETRFHRPAPDSDKPYILEDGREKELVDPQIKENLGIPAMHYGCLGSGKGINQDDSLRRKFAETYGVKAIDPGFGAVFEGIQGSRTASFGVVRALSDYTDGSVRKAWQPYASLVAAAAAKTIIMALPVEEDDSD